MISRMRSGGWQLVVVAMALALPGLWCFGPTVFDRHVLAYRDAAHFYVPLEKWLSDGWRRGEWPLWNPQDGLGTPLAGEASSALFYPGRLLFLAPGSAAQWHAWYTLLHLLVAALGAYGLARCAWRMSDGASTDRVRGTAPWPGSPPPIGSDSRRVSIPAAGLCAVAYTFGGAVLFQYCNTIYLVGAAWLPWALLATHRTLSQQSLRWAIVWGTCLALMILGGDPQSAYHAGLLGLLYVVLRLCSRLASEGPAPGERQISPAAAVSLLGVAGLTMLLLSAVQFVPARSWMRTSDRASFTWPRNVYEIPVYWRRGRAATATHASDGPPPAGSVGRWHGVAAGLFGVPPADEHRGRAEDFSLAPWRLAETLWPNISGRSFPTNRRWLTALAAEDRIWVPSLYMGVVPILLALGAWRVRRADFLVQWFSWVALLAVAASFGRYGVGLAVESAREVWRGEPGPRVLGDGVGGLYWWLVVSLPGYVQFRFPAKWLVPATLAMAVLAAVGCDQILRGPRDRLVRHLRCLGLVSILAALAVALTRTAWIRVLAGSEPDELYGPLDAVGAWRDAVTAGVHSALVCAVAWWLLAKASWRPTRLGAALLLLTACELAWAQGWMVQTVPRSALETPTVLDRLPATGSAATVYRWPTRSWVPSTWSVASSSTRPEETLRWDTATLYGRLHLLGAHRSVHPLSSAPPRDLRTLLATGATDLPHPRVLNLLGIEYLIVPAELAAPDRGWEPLPVRPPVSNVAVWRNTQALPQAWIVHDVEVWPRWESTDPQALRHRCQQLVFPAGQRRDFRHQAVVETDATASLPECIPPSTPSSRESVRCTARTSNDIELEVVLTSPGLVVVSQYYDPHWRATAVSAAGESQVLPLERTNCVMQGVFLPPGRHTLKLHYQPRHLYWAGAISVTSWLLVLGVGTFRLAQAQFRFAR
ncbi:MAG: hypothetical protein MUF48_11710 [Pirellulaceae bacterium]|jgi:hypothetical protein|nr:hypothetical protein [Pirellulaceae bacterium]